MNNLFAKFQKLSVMEKLSNRTKWTNLTSNPCFGSLSLSNVFSVKSVLDQLSKRMPNPHPNPLKSDLAFPSVHRMWPGVILQPITSSKYPPKAGLRYQVPTDGPRFCAHPRKTSIWQHVNQNDEHAKIYLPDGTLRLMTVDRVSDEKNALADKNNLIAWQMHHRLNNLWCTIISYFQWYVICMNIGNAHIWARLGVRCWGFCSSSSSRRPCPRAGWRNPSPSPSGSPAAACCVRCSPSIWNKQVRIRINVFRGWFLLHISWGSSNPAHLICITIPTSSSSMWCPIPGDVSVNFAPNSMARSQPSLVCNTRLLSRSALFPTWTDNKCDHLRSDFWKI